MRLFKQRAKKEGLIPLKRHHPMKTWIYCILLNMSAATLSKAQVVEFDDPALETAIRDALNKQEGDITAADLATITELNLEYTYQGFDGGDTDLVLPKGLVNLTSLILNESLLTSLTLPDDMTSLETLSISDEPHLTSIILPEGLHALKSITLYWCEIESLTLPQGLSGLTKLSLESNGLSSLTLQEDLPNLRILTVLEYRLNDVSFLDRVPNLTHLALGLGIMNDFSFLDQMPNLTGITLYGRNITDFSFLEGRSSLTQIFVFSYFEEAFTLPEGLTNLSRLEISTDPYDIGGHGGSLVANLALPEGMDYQNLEVLGVDEYEITYYRPRLRLRGGGFSNPKEFELTVTGPQGDFIVQSSPDLRQWNDETTFNIPVWQTQVTIPLEDRPEQAFFRLREINSTP